MAKRIRRAKDKRDQKRRRRTKSMAAELADGQTAVAALADLPSESFVAAGGGTIQAQTALLGDKRFLSAQRREIALQIRKTQGNHHLDSVISSIQDSVKNTDGALHQKVHPPTNYIQRRAIRVPSGTTLGTIRFRRIPGGEGGGELRVVTEVVDGRARPGRFAGYRNRIQALALALGQDRICAIGEDRDGRFHVFLTDWPPLSVRSRYQIVPRENRWFNRLWWGNVLIERGRETVVSVRSWSYRAAQANRWCSAWRRRNIPQDFPSGCRHEPRHDNSRSGLRSCLEAEYVDLLAEAIGIGRHEISVARSRGERNPNALLTFDLEMEAGTRGRGGIAGALPTTRTGPVPRPSVAIGPSAFVSESRLHVIATFIHETEHFSHAARSIELLERWRRSGSRVTFEDWLRREKRRWERSRRMEPRPGISPIEFDLVISSIRDSDHATETLAYLEGFTSAYHRLPITRTSYRFHQIDGMADYWPRAGHEINDESIHRLAGYYRGLDQVHQEDLAAHARRAYRQFRNDPIGRGIFWNRVVNEVISQ